MPASPKISGSTTRRLRSLSRAGDRYRKSAQKRPPVGLGTGGVRRSKSETGFGG